MTLRATRLTITPTTIALLVHTILAALKTRHQLAMENLALRHQIQVLQRHGKRPRLTRADRGLWVFLSRIWHDWRDCLFVVKPDTVVRWHRMGFKLYWRWKRSKRKRGRPRISPELVALICKMSLNNPLWGAPRIPGELLKLGIDLAQSTTIKYMRRTRRPPSQTRKTFLRNHLGETASIDFLTVPTATIQIIYVYLVLSHKRRRVIDFNVTEFPSAKWTARQLIEAFPWDTAPEFLLPDRHSIYGHEVVRTIHNLRAELVLTTPRSPWQNPYVERVIGSIRREYLDHLILGNENHLRKVRKEYFGITPSRGLTWHSARTARSQGRSSRLRGARSSPSPSSVGYIIGTRGRRPEPHQLSTPRGYRVDAVVWQEQPQSGQNRKPRPGFAGNPAP